MSAIAESVKFRFIGLLKQLRRRLDGTPIAPESPAETLPSANPPPPTAQAPSASADSSPTPTVGTQISIPLCTIVDTLPMELRARLKTRDTTGLVFSLPVERILPQLAGGVVKVTFGELRQALPQAFAPGSGCDQVEVTLPLGEILSRLNPALLPRRTGQKQLTVPSHVTGPFEHGARGVTLSVGKPQSEPGPVRGAGAPAPIAGAAAAGARTAPIAQPVIPPTPPSTVHSATGPAQRPAAGTRPVVQPPNDVPAEIFRRAPGPAQPASPAPPATPAFPKLPGSTSVPTAPPTTRPETLQRSHETLAHRQPHTHERPATPVAALPAERTATVAQNGSRPAAPAATSAPAPTQDEPTVSVELSAVLGQWPEGLRQEIVQQNLATARLALPVSLLESSLRQGRAVFRWKALRAYLEPGPPTAVSPFDAAELELPLSVLAPLFIAHRKAAATPKRRLTVDDSIPNLFSSVAPAELAPPPAVPRVETPAPDAVSFTSPASALTTPPGPRENKVVDTNYYVWDDVQETARVDETEFKRRPASSGTDFIVKYATPNEIVSRAAALDGVAGALIALPDGLMVASRIPPEFNGDTLAAFLPQIFARVSQCTKELRMGELNNLAFTVGNVPWKIFRVNAIFFAAFGRQGEALPTAPLAALAAELDRRQR